MNQAGPYIIQQLAGKLSLEDKSPEQIQTLIDRYPYFGFAHLLLTKQLQDIGDAGAVKQLQKTALHFTNPFWLQYLLKENQTTGTGTSIPETPISEQIQSTEVAAEPVAVTEEIAAVTALPQENTPEVVLESTEINEDDLPVDEYDNTENTAITGNLSKLIEQHLSDYKKPVEGNGELIAKTNPFHTIDYFASQGIKFIAGQQPDMLGNKVKSFTEWLKQMKRINQQPTDLGTDAETEHIIEAIAKTSNETKDVITETMASVLAKQGKIEKAIQLYQKLSFLDTAKSTYFAAKIQELKAK